jgi:hypothetical protein
MEIQIQNAFYLAINWAHAKHKLAVATFIKFLMVFFEKGCYYGLTCVSQLILATCH